MCDTHTHLESVFAVWQLEEESVRAVPVAVDNVNLPVAIKICQSHAPSMLRSVLYSCVSERKGIIISVCVCVCACLCVCVWECGCACSCVRVRVCPCGCV